MHIKYNIMQPIFHRVKLCTESLNWKTWFQSLWETQQGHLCLRPCNLSISFCLVSDFAQEPFRAWGVQNGGVKQKWWDTTWKECSWWHTHQRKKEGIWLISGRALPNDSKEALWKVCLRIPRWTFWRNLTVN